MVIVLACGAIVTKDGMILCVTNYTHTFQCRQRVHTTLLPQGEVFLLVKVKLKYIIIGLHFVSATHVALYFDMVLKENCLLCCYGPVYYEIIGATMHYGWYAYTYLSTCTYACLPTYRPICTYMHLLMPTNMPIYLHASYLPMPMYLPTYLCLPMYLPTCLPICLPTYIISTYMCTVPT